MPARPDASPVREAEPRWSVSEDYLADPAVAPIRALVAAVARRLAARKRGRARRFQDRERRKRHALPSNGFAPSA